MTTFDANATLVSDRLHLRPLQESDRDALYAAASDPETWAQHPASNRHEQEVFYPYFDYRLASGGTLAVSVRDTSEVIGCSRFYPVPDHPGEYGIGFTFLARSHWGGSWNKEMKELMVGHALKHFERVWFHIAPTNQRSQIATTRLGAKFAYDAELQVGLSPAMTKCYTLTREDWETATGIKLPA
ncbi:MAG: N-acetyltransferase [Hyphomicrobiaceae bacterium TMED74]|nr:GNAT family N-acetyltransferase [Filomicrobium sp.]RPG35373.1 MAG: N-acetyltransferase [Hyphomicrobiaceae bacterium TMED74]